MNSSTTYPASRRSRASFELGRKRRVESGQTLTKVRTKRSDDALRHHLGLFAIAFFLNSWLGQRVLLRIVRVNRLVGNLTLLNLMDRKTGGLYCFKIGSTCSFMIADAACKTVIVSANSAPETDRVRLSTFKQQRGPCASTSAPYFCPVHKKEKTSFKRPCFWKGLCTGQRHPGDCLLMISIVKILADALTLFT
jgi:hypothetical protein